MVHFNSTIQKFGNKGEKTGWIYTEISADIAYQIKPNYKKSYRVKGNIDELPVQGCAMLPMGEGNFIIALNAGMRKALKKIEGDGIKLSLEEDDDVVKLSATLLECIGEVEEANVYFQSLPPSHKQYYSNWVKAAKSDAVIANRISVIIKACVSKLSYAEMMQQYKKDKER